MYVLKIYLRCINMWNKKESSNLVSVSILICGYIFRLYGFKIHPLAYQLQYQAAANFKMPMRGIGYNNGKR